MKLFGNDMISHPESMITSHPSDYEPHDPAIVSFAVGLGLLLMAVPFIGLAIIRWVLGRFRMKKQLSQ